MEPTSVPKGYSRDLITLLALLESWNEKSFQKFLESGVFHDILEAISLNKMPVIEIKKRDMLYQPTSFGDVSSAQSVKFVSSLSKVNIKFFCTAFRVWSATAGWWEVCEEFNWATRDEWRVEMGLKRINPIRRSNEDKVDVIFKRIKNEEVWETTPDGYRYSTLEEIQQTKAPQSYQASTLIKVEEKWYLVDGFRSEEVSKEDLDGFFKNGTIYHGAGQMSHIFIALVKN